MDDAALKQWRNLARIFQHRAMKELDRARRDGVRFAYYTTADTALKIIRQKTIWMRDVQCMNDYSEVALGYQRVRESSGAFIASLDGLSLGLSKAVSDTFQALQSHLQEVYICCLSEHLASEDAHGRLSMWRAYGGRAGVALVLRFPLDDNVKRAEALRTPSAAVEYYGPADFAAHMKELQDQTQRHRAELVNYPQKTLHLSITQALLMLSVASKHPGFKEEREWRVAHIPSVARSTVLRCDIESVDGIPQRVYKLPLRNDPAQGITGIDIVDLLDRVIIGPCTYPRPLAAALLDALVEAKVPDASRRVWFSDIPLRTRP